MKPRQPGRCADCSRTGLVALTEAKMEDATKASVAVGATSACEAQPADSRNMLMDGTLRDMQAAAPRSGARGQLGSGVVRARMCIVGRRYAYTHMYTPRNECVADVYVGVKQTRV